MAGYYKHIPPIPGRAYTDTALLTLHALVQETGPTKAKVTRAAQSNNSQPYAQVVNGIGQRYVCWSLLPT